jgi:hypothetical protein
LFVGLGMSALGVPAERRGRLHHWLLGKAADSMKRTNIYVGAHASDGIDERVGVAGGVATVGRVSRP